MFKRLYFIMILCLLPFSQAMGEDLSPKDTLYLEYPTMLDYSLAAWDTVFVVISRGQAIVDTVWLEQWVVGIWTGSYYLDGLPAGSYNRRYCAVYSTDTTGEVYPFGIRDTLELQSKISWATLGSNTITITLKRDSDSTVIIGGNIEVKITPGGTNYYIGATNQNGQISFLSDNDTLFVYIDAHPITFTTPETLRIDGNESVTYYGTPFDPGSPPSADLCRVYGYVYDINNVPIESVKVEMSIAYTPLRFSTIVISPYYKSTLTDSLGYWYLDVYPNANLTPVTTKYQVYIYLTSGQVVKRDVTVPDQASWEFTW